VLATQPKARRLAIGIVIGLVAIVAIALAAGGKGNEESGGSASGAGLGAPTSSSAVASHGSAKSTATVAGGVAAIPAHAPAQRGPASGSSGSTGEAATSSADIATSQLTGSGDGLGATRVVKTGNVAIEVPKGHVQSTIEAVTKLPGQYGGYVSSSQTSSANSASGEITLRIPVDRFEQVVVAVEKLGHETSVSTNAEDVTGKFVDLKARAAALKRTRQTYLTILGRTSTIGQILSVQQRVNDVQSSIERLQGELKVLRNQSSDGTLTVDVSQAGTATTVKSQHKRTGLGLAWHNSVSRFLRGFDAIVGALGPLLLAAILLGLGYLIVRLGTRAARRSRDATS
jgi:hypothetical protein